MEAKQAAQELIKENVKPCLAVVLVGDNPASKAYVGSKVKACEEVGIRSIKQALDSDVTQADLLQAIDDLNQDVAVHGILVQLPLPHHIDENAVIERIDPAKDVDGFHPVNAGKLMIGLDCLAPCTPAGIPELIVREHLEKYTREADILIAAIGVPEFVTAGMVKDGAVVIDVGINRVDDLEHSRGYRLVGDVAFDEVKEVAGAITPVPGGVGPMTVAMLMKNTVKAAKMLSL